MKLFQTCNMEIIRLSQQMFNFLFPSELIEKRANKFLHVGCCYNLVNIVTYLIYLLFFFYRVCMYVCNVLLCMYAYVVIATIFGECGPLCSLYCILKFFFSASVSEMSEL